MDGLKKGVEANMDCLKKGIEAKMIDVEAKMDDLKIYLKTDIDELKINVNKFFQNKSSSYYCFMGILVTFFKMLNDMVLLMKKIFSN